MGTRRMVFTLNGLEELSSSCGDPGDSFRFSYLRSITECAADNRSIVANPYRSYFWGLSPRLEKVNPAIQRDALAPIASRTALAFRRGAADGFRVGELRPTCCLGQLSTPDR
jgi:hypothetical protein